ncbi:MAG: ribonuclease R [Fusobacteriaceae bacterium]
MKINKEKEKILELFKKNNSLKYEEIVKLAGWSKKFKGDNKNILDEMIEEGDLVKNQRGKYSSPERHGFVKGEFNIIKDRFAFVDTPTEGIFVPRVHFNGALDGDIVMIRVKEGYYDKSKKEGEVVKIIKRNRDTVIGVFQKMENFGFVVPTHSFGKDIFIPYKAMGKAKHGELVVVKLDFWGDEKKKPEGTIIEVIGDPSNTDNMLEALIKREGMREDFPDEALAEARRIPVTIEENEIKRRKDLRNLKIITIDGADAKDLDDAVYVEKHENGNYRLIVAIADVSHYIPVGSNLDKEAEKRGNSVYMVDRVLPMFPKEISNGICSLNPREDKLTFTCDMLFDSKGKMISADTYKSVIRTVHRMTYGDVNLILAGDGEKIKEYEDILEEVGVMAELAKLIRGLKYTRGSIDFDIPEAKVILDEKGKVKEVKKIERGESERIIEDFMIAANEAIAEKLFWLEVPSIYRIHEKPDAERIQILNEILGKFKYRIHDLEDVHPKRFQKIVEDSKERGLNLIVHKSILMALKQARYSKENLGHFGLASGFYTHFTSPIRRYADLMVHRVLALTLNGYPEKKALKGLAERLENIALHISKTERDAMGVEDESKKIKIVDYMKDKVGEEYEATIIGFNNKKVFFETELNIECFWDITAAQDDYYEFNEHEFTMTGKNTGKIYSLGEKHRVRIARVDLPNLEIEGIPVEDENEQE